MGVTQTLKGTEGDGVLQIGLGAVTLILLLIPRVKPRIPLIFCILTIVIATVDYNSLSEVNAELEGISSFDYGFYMVIIAVIGMFGGTIMAFLQERKS